MMYLLLCILILILTIIIVTLNIKINNITILLEQILDGNYNQRIRMQNHNKAVNNLSQNINYLIEKFQKTIKLNRDYEEERKKMISNISHDLRTPLTSLLGYVELLNHDDNLNKEERQEYIQIVEKKGNALLNLMEEFFRLSKLESNDIKLNIISVNLSEIIRQSIVLFYSDFMRLNIEPIINIPEKDYFVLGDTESINRILNNLISNALKYGAYGGVIGIDLKEENNNIIVDIWDKGKGIPKEELPLIFERLHTLEKSRNRKFQGSGLGLTIAKKLAEAQKGELTVSSIPNEKTVFSLSLRKS